MTITHSSPARGIALAIIAIVFLGVMAGLGACLSHTHHHHAHGCASETQQGKVMYTCPMHPSYRSDKPGTCPICGMTLVPVKEEPQGSNEGADKGAAATQMPGMEMSEQGKSPQAQKDKDARAAVTIDSERQQRIGVTTAKVASGPAIAEIRAAGRVAFDPDLAVAQREYIEARRLGDKDLLDASRRRLTLMGMGKEQIDQLSGKSAPDTNLVLPGKGAWIYASIYERELPHVKIGQTASIELPDGTSVGSGIIRAVDPVLDPQTRTSRVRVEVDNSKGMLKPNMFVTALLHDDLGERLLVPKSAVIDSGKRKLVFVVHGSEHFMPRDVILGPELEGNYVVESGLEAGDVVATAALFLIDSESQLKAAAGAVGGHKHD